MNRNFPHRFLRACAALLSLALIAGLATGQSVESYRPLLWDRDGPGCIFRTRDADPNAIPTAELRPKLDERFGPLVTEDTLLAADDRSPWGNPVLRAPSTPTTTIVYTDPREAGFNDPVLGPSRRYAFAVAASRVAALFGGTGNISIDASFPAKNKPNNLAAASPGQYWRNLPGLPANIWYPEFLVEHKLGSDPDSSQLDIVVSFNRDWDDDGVQTWYYGTDANPPAGMLDFVTVAMHELIHGLGFAQSFGSSGALPSNNPNIYDLFLMNDELEPLVSLSPSQYNVAGSKVQWSGPFGGLAYTGIFGGPTYIRMYAPWPWESGSSLSHLDEDTFEGEWGLLTPFLSSGQAVGEVDPIVRGMLEDMGYAVKYAEIYVDPAYVGASTGTPSRPYRTVAEGVAAAENSGRAVRIRGGTYNVSPLTVSSNVRLERWYTSPATLR